MTSEMQEVRVFVDFIVTDSKVFVMFTPCATINAYDECLCYLCANLYGQTRIFSHVRYGHMVCEHCLYRNGHKIEQWEPLFKTICDKDQMS